MARTDQPHKLTYEAFVAKCSDPSDPRNEKHTTLDYGREETRSAWTGSKGKIPIWCCIHEEFFVQQAANHMNGQGCPKCGKDVYKAKRRKADPVTDFRKTHGDLYDYSHMVYVNVHTPIEIGCSKHGAFFQKPNAHLSGHGCPECWEDRRKRFGEARNDDFKATFAERAAAVHNGVYTITRLPESAHDTVELLCPTHGAFEQKAYSHLDGHGCWSCGQNTNFAELEVADLIKGFGVAVEHENRTVLGGMHIDIWAPDQRIGVEYHGAYWHTEDRVGKKHLEKYLRASDAGIRLIQIFDFEWLERRGAVTNRLSALFGKGPSFAARKCHLREITKSEAHRFFDEVHTQGSGKSPEVAYGLFDDDTLLAAMSFCPGRFGHGGWELLRYASHGRVQGGFSRLLSTFVRDRNPDQITSFCDLRWGDGVVYQKNGFRLDGVTPPDYWYVDRRGKKLSRFAAQKRPDGQSERSWADGHGYKRVLGVGHQRWVWDKP